MRVEAVITGRMAGEVNWACTASFQLNQAPAGIGALQAAATAAFSALSTSTQFRAGFCADTTVTELKLIYYPLDAPPASFTAIGTGTAFAGTATTAYTPQVAVVASLRSNFAGRSNRGRMYVPYRASNISTAGVVNATGQALVAQFANLFQSQVVAALAAQNMGSVWSVYSRKLNGSVAITSVLVGNQVDTLRDRNPNRAEGYTAFAVTPIAVAPDDPDLPAIQQSTLPPAAMYGKPHGNENAPEIEQPLPVEIVPD